MERRRISALAWSVIVGLLGCAAMSVWSLVAELDRAGYADGLTGGTATFDPNHATALDDRVAAANATSFVVLLATGILFIVWQYRMVARLNRSGRPLRHSPGWAIGGWFVPFLNLVRPKQMIDDAWRATGPVTTPSRRIPVRLHLWWALWVVSSVLAALAAYAPHSTPQELAGADRLSAVADALTMLAAALAIVLVAQLSRRASLVPEPLPASAAPGMMLFNPPPGWPSPPAGWQPPPGWQPDPSWPPAPQGWVFWIPRHQRWPADWPNPG